MNSSTISAVTTIFFIINVALVAKYRQHAILKKRIPLLLVIRQISGICLVNIRLFGFPCILTQFVGKIVIICEIIRCAYTSNIIVKPDTFGKRISKVLWNNGQVSLSSWMIAVSLAILSETVYRVFGIVSTTDLQTYCTNDSDLKAIYIIFVSLLVQSPYFYGMLRYAIYDDATIEFVFSQLLSVLIAALMLTEYLSNEFLVITMLISGLFWASTFPLLVCAYKNYRARNIVTIQGIKYPSKLLQKTSEELFCGELISFIIDYQLYKLNPDSYEMIKYKYLRIDSPSELNLTEDLREHALFSCLNIDKVYLEVADLVFINVVPHLFHDDKFI